MPLQDSESLNGAEAMVRMLQGYGVQHIFGLCGDTSLPFYDALYRLDHGIEHILTRDERSAAYMADAYARVTGRVGICEGPSGGGATYILPGLVEANESSIPVLAITTDVSVAARGRYPLTELDQEGLFRPLTKWNGVIDRSERLGTMVRAAFRAMTTGRSGAAHLGFPFDIQKAMLPVEETWCQSEHGQFPAWPAAPDASAVEAAADALLSASNPVVVCGGGVVLAGGEAALDQLARKLDVVIATTVSGQGSLAETHANCLGVVGSNGGTPATRAVLEQADLVVFVGCRAGSVTTERWRAPKRDTRIVHLDSDPMAVAANYPTEVAVVGDARLSLEALCAEIDSRASNVTFDGTSLVATAKAEKSASWHELAMTDAKPIRPERVIHTMREVLPDDAVIVADPGTPCPYFSAYYELRQAGRHFITNRAHGALGYALPASVGAQIGRPDKQVISVMGDGSFGFACGELETVTRLGLPITFVVFSNSVYGWIKAGQKSGFGERYFSVDFDRTDHAAVAEAFGVRAWRVEEPADLQPALAAAIRHDGPALVDVISQPLQEARAPVSEWVA